MNEKIKLEDTIQDMILKMGESNFGGTTVCINILKQGKEIDPYSEPLFLILMQFL